MNEEVILFGGDGFLGKGLQKHLRQKSIIFKSIDKGDYDLINFNNLSRCVEDLQYATKVVILAAKLGANLFNSSLAYISSEYNKQIYDFIFSAMQKASQLYKKSFDVTYYSTSEIYGNRRSENDLIKDNSEYMFNIQTERKMYSYTKYLIEKELLKMQSQHPEIISNVKIVRPFNVYGRNQKRGVVYEMIKSAICKNIIFYSKDTTRTMTDIDYASDIAVKVILSKEKNIAKNIADSICSLTMKQLAIIIANVLNNDCKLIEKDHDENIQYRNVSSIKEDISTIQRIMQPHVLELAKQIRNER